MVFSGLYPVDGDEYPELRDALDKLQLNDAALVYEPETSTALGFGFRCGFLGLLHMEIVRERLEREFDLTPHLHRAERGLPRRDGERPRAHGDQPERLPRRHRRLRARDGTPKGNTGGKIKEVYEPIVRATVISPSDYIGTIMELCQGRRGVLQGHGVPVHRPGRDPLHDAARPRSSSTSSTSSRAGPAATPASTTSPTASRSRTWSRSTSCSRASRWTRSARSCTPTTPASTACR